MSKGGGEGQGGQTNAEDASMRPFIPHFIQLPSACLHVSVSGRGGSFDRRQAISHLCLICSPSSFSE